MTDPLLEVIRRHWGYDALRPLQREAMDAALARRDSLVVLPTGGGKSLCYQAPALLADGVTVVVSPLISLMKDQVDALLARGVPAAFLNSSLDIDDRRRVRAGLARGEYRLIFVAPERFAGDGFFRAIEDARVSAFAIDEAHCISHWGHDFRADYRELGQLKQRFPDVPVHAFTATATPRVRDDIVEQLALRDPAVLVGDFFRPNLRYRAVDRTDAFEDVRREVAARAGQAGIVYCIRRSDVDALARRLKGEGVRVAPYHAGMDDDARTRAQERFAAGAADVVVATVAFGMGIDRADIRYVIHAAMPKSLEHYQQETGRAGRDGQPADCILFHSGGDYGLWRSLIEKNEADDKLRMLSEMYSYCRSSRCRHRSLVEYFGQPWKGGPCGACDVCNGERTPMPGGGEIARRALAGVRDTGQRYGAAYVADVLVGRRTDRVVSNRHDGVASFAALSDSPHRAVVTWLRQLAEAEFLRLDGEYAVLKLTGTGWKAVRGEAEAALYGAAPVATKRRKSKVTQPAPEPADSASSDLFEQLRALRRRIADDRGVPAFMVFSDRTLRALAQARPRTKSEMMAVHGVGPAKWEAFGEEFLRAIEA